MNVAVSPDTALPIAQTLFQALQEQHQLQSETIHEVVSCYTYKSRHTVTKTSHRVASCHTIAT